MFTAAAIQMDCVVGYQKKNLSRAENFVLEAVDAGAKLIALPELFSTGAFDFRKEDLSELMYHKTTRFLRGLAENNGVHVAGSFIEKVSNGRRNTTILCGPRGIMGTYHKVYLWKAEVPFLKPGNEFPVAETELGRIGIMTCYDIAFPEAGRTLGRKRADVVVSGSAFYTHDIWDFSTRARSYENSFYHVASNRIGNDTGRPFCGYTRIVDPLGHIIAEAKKGEGVIFADIDIGLARKVRKEVGFFKDPE
jgi:predicted amidohydrolase